MKPCELSFKKKKKSELESLEVNNNCNDPVCSIWFFLMHILCVAQL